MRTDIRVLPYPVAASVIVAVCAAGAFAGTVDVRVSTGNDDAEERADTSMYTNSTDLELAYDSGSQTDTVGMRFQSIAVPSGATIANAYVQFKCDETSSGTTTLTIYGQDVDDAAGFSAVNGNITGRTTTSATVGWSPPAWNSAGAAGADQRTPDISSIIQEIVDRGGWASGNDIVIIIDGTGTRTAEAYEGDASGAPLLHIEYSEPGGAGGGVTFDYTEAFQSFQASGSDSWRTMDLSGSPYNVPADAVVEIAVYNYDTDSDDDAQRWGGVRAYGSSLDRRIQLQEAESRGWDMITMFAQADASSRIEVYADSTSRVRFCLLGWWTGVEYTEAWQTFKAGGTGWRDHNLSGYGVSAGEVAEIVMINNNSAAEREAGLRENLSSLERRLDLHEAEGGGDDTATMLVKADDSSIIDVYAENNTDIDFYLAGYWTTPPGRYTQAFTDVGSPNADNAWRDEDLTAHNVPEAAVAEFVLANDYEFAENTMGVRANGSSLARLVDVHEAEAGGSDFGRMHVYTGTDGTIEFRHEDVSEAHTFRLVGWWEPDREILFVVPDPNSLATEDAARQTTFRTLGWRVNRIDDGDTQGNFDTAMADADVAYVCENVSVGSLGTKLTDARIGVVIEPEGSFDDFDITASAGSTYSGTQIDVQAVSHYITAPFATGNKTIVTSSQPMTKTSEGVPSSALVLAEQPSSADKALVVVDWCDEDRGRRVVLPWGGGAFDWTALDANGLLVLERSLDWAAAKKGHWRLDETDTTTTAADTSGRGNDGTLTNMSGAEWDNGLIQNALLMDGSNDYIVISGIERPTAAFTYAFWMRPTNDLDSADAREDMIYGVPDARPHISFNKLGGGEIGCYLKIDGVDHDDLVTTTTTWTANTWYHIVCTFDGTDAKIYVDAALEKTVTHAGTHDDSTGMHLGQRSTTNNFAGFIDDVRIYGISMTDDEIDALYNACSRPIIISWQEVEPD